MLINATLKMEENVLVSIIIPIYNSEAYIADTIKSCLNQTYTHFELLLVNDGSTDTTEQVINLFADTRIRYYKVKNGGACNARNFGISKAQGQLVQFLDHDDVLDEHKIEKQVEHYLRYGDDYLYSGDMGTISGQQRVLDAGFELFKKDFEPQQFFEEKYMEFGKDIVTGAWLVPIQLVNSTHGWDDSAGLNDDGEYFLRVILNSSGIKYCPGAIFYFRRDVPNSLSKQFGSRKVYEKWLNSYQLYVHAFLQKLQPAVAKELGWKALSIYYCNSYPHYPDLRKKCRQAMLELGYKTSFAYGGELFKKIARWVGVDNALRIASLKGKLSGK